MVELRKLKQKGEEVEEEGRLRLVFLSKIDLILCNGLYIQIDRLHSRRYSTSPFPYLSVIKLIFRLMWLVLLQRTS